MSPTYARLSIFLFKGLVFNVKHARPRDISNHKSTRRAGIRHFISGDKSGWTPEVRKIMICRELVGVFFGSFRVAD